MFLLNKYREVRLVVVSIQTHRERERSVEKKDADVLTVLRS